MDNLRCVRETPPHLHSGAGRASHEENASRLTGTVERITYQNAENRFSVIKCRAKGYSDLVTVVGNMPDVHVGSVLSMQGQCQKFNGWTAQIIQHEVDHLHGQII